MKAPVVVFAYNRVTLLQNLMGALSRCTHVSEHDCHVFVDAPNFKKKDDRPNVDAVLKYLYAIKDDCAFNKMIIHKAPRHMGLRESVIGGITEIISQYDRVIGLEDDLLVSSDFLDYMDSALDYYAMNKNIWSVTGHCNQLRALKNYNRDFFLSYRISSLGYGTWKDRWMMTDWEIEDYKVFSQDTAMVTDFAEQGFDLPRMIDMQANEILDSWAITWCYSAYRHKMATVYPSKSKVTHEGVFGTNIHGANIKQQQLEEMYDKLDFSSCEMNESIKKEYAEFFMKQTDWEAALKAFRTEKHLRFHNLYNRWMTYKEQGILLSFFFLEREWKHIAIYGAADLGVHLLKELNDTEIAVDYFIDKMKQGKINDIPIYNIGDELPVVDVIVVTPIMDYYSIKSELRKKVSAEIVSIYKVVM